MVKFCPECGGDLNFDTITKNFICWGCGLYAPREKFEELHEKINTVDRKNKSDNYTDWWQSSKKDKKNDGSFLSFFLFISNINTVLQTEQISSVGDSATI